MGKVGIMKPGKWITNNQQCAAMLNDADTNMAIGYQITFKMTSTA
jgi:hypothetical protein